MAQTPSQPGNSRRHRTALPEVSPKDVKQTLGEGTALDLARRVLPAVKLAKPDDDPRNGAGHIFREAVDYLRENPRAVIHTAAIGYSPDKFQQVYILTPEALASLIRHGAGCPCSCCHGPGCYCADDPVEERCDCPACVTALAGVTFPGMPT